MAKYPLSAMRMILFSKILTSQQKPQKIYKLRLKGLLKFLKTSQLAQMKLVSTKREAMNTINFIYV